jgi:hypothetical protein
MAMLKSTSTLKIQFSTVFNVSFVHDILVLPWIRPFSTVVW